MGQWIENIPVLKTFEPDTLYRVGDPRTSTWYNVSSCSPNSIHSIKLLPCLAITRYSLGFRNKMSVHFRVWAYLESVLDFFLLEMLSCWWSRCVSVSFVLNCLCSGALVCSLFAVCKWVKKGSGPIYRRKRVGLVKPNYSYVSILIYYYLID